MNLTDFIEEREIKSYWKESADLNKKIRINWKELLGGKSLNEHVSEQQGKGVKLKDILTEVYIIGRLNEHKLRDKYGISLEEFENRAKIGVGARASESAVHKQNKKQGMYKVQSWRAKVRYENGRKTIIVSPKVDIREGDYVEVKVVKLGD